MYQIKLCKNGNTLSLIAVYFSILFFPACGVNTVKQEPISETESCNRLQAIIKDHANQFKNYKKTKFTHKTHNSWAADKVLPTAQQCQVWEWSNGLNNYACDWEVEDGENKAIANYDEALRITQTCLGSSWTAQTNSTQSGGKHTVFNHAGLPTVVSIRYFEDTAGWSFLHSWYNTLIIGDKNNLKSPLQ
jgi:hypothetical protein